MLINVRPSWHRCMAFLAVLAPACLLGGGIGQAGSAVNTGYFGGVAIMGYDPVAYFTEGRPMKGSEEFTLEWLGADWQFASAEHRDLFAEQPVKYAPQYGGHCSAGVAFGENTINIDPEAWSIVDGKLYLQYSKSGSRNGSSTGRSGSLKPRKIGRKSRPGWRMPPAGNRSTQLCWRAAAGVPTSRVPIARPKNARAKLH